MKSSALTKLALNRRTCGQETTACAQIVKHGMHYSRYIFKKNYFVNITRLVFLQWYYFTCDVLSLKTLKCPFEKSQEK